MRVVALAIVLVSSIAVAEKTSAGGITWTAPAEWKEQPARPMRAATYLIPAAKGDKEDAELAVFYFGVGQGGSVDANVKRWIGQFEQPNGKPSDQVAKTEKKKIHGLDVTTVDLSGTYLAPVGGMMSGQTERKENYRLLGAIVEAPEGPVFFKMTGPEKTVAAAKPKFDKLIKSTQATKK